MGRKPEHGIRPVNFENKMMIRVDCDHCHTWDIVSDYERNIHTRNFTQDFRECPKCHVVYCETCLKREKCPSCNGRTVKLTPEEVYVCNHCIGEWGDKGGLCGWECKYHSHKK